MTEQRVMTGAPSLTPESDPYSERLRVVVLSQTPGVGGGERVVLPALAGADALAITVVGHESVCNYAARLALPAVELALPHASRLAHALRVLVGGWRVVVKARALGAQVLYANGARAIVYAIVARLLGGPPVLAHHHGILTTGPTRSFARAMDRFCSLVVVPSESGTAGLRRRKTTIIPNGIDLSHFAPSDDRLAAKRSLGLPGAPVVGMVTRADPRKGMRPFLRVAEMVADASADAHFLLVGGATFPHEVREYAEIVAQSERLGDRLTLTGYINDPRAAFHAMDLLVHLSEPESFPTALIEAQACGVPVVAYRWGGASEIVVETTTGYLVEPLEESAAEAIVRALQDEGWRARAAEAGRELACKRFGLERFASDLTDAIKQVIEN